LGQGQVASDRIVPRPIPTDAHAARRNCGAGGVDMAEALPLQDIQRLRQSQEIIVSEKVGHRWEAFGFNCATIIWQGYKFRQVASTIDREALHQVAILGTGVDRAG
jgi:peptide/nickel transport system substrate-binding protein